MSGGGHPPQVDEFRLEDLADEQEYRFETEDGWMLVVTRYRPRPQPFPRPIAGVPCLLVHGFSQSRHAWTSGEFVKNMAFFGADLHLVELRGHGKSSISLQRRLHRQEGRPLPRDLAWGWDVDSYFMLDLPAALREVKRRTGRERVLYIGHSMGGMLGYGLASWRQQDLLGLVTIGAPSDIGRGFPLLKTLAVAEPLGFPAVDAALAPVNRARTLRRKLTGRGPEPVRFDVLPVDLLLRGVQAALNRPGTLLGGLPKHIPLLWNPERTNPDAIKSLLNIGGGPEPRRVVEQFTRWIRRDELKCYRLEYDFKAHFHEIEIPLAIIFGDEDRVARLESTASIYRGASSAYLLWRPVKGNSHIDLTMGHDIRQVCYDIKNLADYALEHASRPPSLPRLDRASA